MNRLQKIVSKAQHNGHKLLIPFITAGYPSLKTTEDMVCAMDNMGVHMVEIGVPFSDPLADGPVIQESSKAALINGATLKKILLSVKKIRKKVDLGIIIFSSINPIYAYGVKRFFSDAHSCGVDGILVPDCPPEESGQLVELCKKFQISNILLVAPTTPVSRLKKIDRISDTFVYCVSSKGVTGVRKGLSQSISGFLKRVKENIKKPYVVGFGIATPQDAKKIAQKSDGVVVGSALINIITNSKKDKVIKNVTDFLSSFKRALS